MSQNIEALKDQLETQTTYVSQLQTKHAQLITEANEAHKEMLKQEGAILMLKHLIAEAEAEEIKKKNKNQEAQRRKRRTK